MKPFRIALVGCGVVGRMHLREALAVPGCEVAAVYDLNAGAAESVAKANGIARFGADAAEALADPGIDGVVLALPTALRQEPALRALAAGKHLLLEKPMGMDAVEVEALLRARGHATAACCSARMSLMTHARRAQAAYASGALGDLRSIHCWATSPLGERPTTPPPAWRVSRTLNGGGILMNWGVYDFDFLLGLSGWKLKPVAVSARMWSVADHAADRVAPGSDGETHLTAFIRFACGAVLVYERGEFTAAPARQEWQVMGDRGALRLHLFDAKATAWLDHADPDTGVASSVLHADPTSTEEFMVGPLADWVSAARDGRRPQTGLEEALVLTRLTDAIYRSAREGRECAIAATA